MSSSLPSQDLADSFMTGWLGGLKIESSHFPTRNISGSLTYMKSSSPSSTERDFRDFCTTGWLGGLKNTECTFSNSKHFRFINLHEVVVAVFD